MTSTDFAIQQAINGLTIGAYLAIIALGYTMVYGIIELINFAHGDVFAAGFFISLTLFRFFGHERETLTGFTLIWVFSVIAALTMFACGLINVTETYTFGACSFPNLTGISTPAPFTGRTR